METSPQHPPPSAASDLPASDREWQYFGRAARRFLAGAMLVYCVLYGLSEWMVYRFAQTNRFFVIQSTPPAAYDWIVLGASHAAALGYQDMGAQLNADTGQRVLNLGVAGAGIHVSRLVYDYFLTRHQTRGIVYVADAFTFHAAAWNEERLQDRSLFVRTPFDVALLARLLRNPSTWTAGLAYASGFPKINNHERWVPDVSEDERTRFTRRYRPVPQLDEQRLAYLYPRGIDLEARATYLAALDDLLDEARGQGQRVLVLKPPLPRRMASALPDEEAFTRALRAVLTPHQVPLHDFSGDHYDDALFYDTDHLNREGVQAFFAQSLVPLLRQAAR